MAQFIHDLYARGVEIMWLTTWANWANVGISPLMGLPHFPVAGEPQWEQDRWWKLAQAQRLYEEDRKPFIWIDDDLDYDEEAIEWLATLPSEDFLAIAPDPRKGITPSQIAKINEWLEGRL